MKIDGNQIKVGNILEINSKLWKVLKTQHTQPGKGGAYLQVEMKEIREGTKMNERFRSSESVERAILDEKLCQYLYSENKKFVFITTTVFTIITWIGGCITILYLNNNFSFSESFIKTIFIGLAALTLPHMTLIDFFYRKKFN